TRVVPHLAGRVTVAHATGQFLSRQLWVWPIIAAVLFGGTGWWVHQSVENAMREQRAADLNAMVDARVNSIRVWMGEQRINVQLFAQDEQLRLIVSELVRLGGNSRPERELLQARAQESLRARLKPRLRLIGYLGYFVVSPGGIVIAADQDAPVGKALAG